VNLNGNELLRVEQYFAFVRNRYLVFEYMIIAEYTNLITSV